MNLGDIRSRTEPFHFPQGTRWSHKGEVFIHLAGNSLDFLNKNIGDGNCFRGHAIEGMFTHPLTRTPGYAVCIKG